MTSPLSDRHVVTNPLSRPDSGITDPLVVRHATPAGSELPVGTLVADSYRVEAGPLGQGTGEAEVYRCRDESLGETVALKLYRTGLQPREGVVEKRRGVSHPQIVALKDTGAWQGRFFEVMEFCDGGTLADLAPPSEERIVEMLRAIVDGLHYLHTAGIVHRDIKPSNLLFRDRQSRELAIADFGISSDMVSEAPGGVRKTGTAHRFTPDYGPPELRSDKADYYSLGITLIHLLLGHSPFCGQTDQDILVAHLLGRVPMPPGISERMQDLLAGLTAHEPELRWGYRQVIAWLERKTVVTDDGRVWQRELVHPRQLPRSGYPGYPDARTPKDLAAALDKFPAEEQLFKHDDVRRWVFHHFDAALAQRIDEIAENYGSNRPLGLFKLRYILDPSLPIEVGPHQIRTLAELADMLATEDRGLQRLLGDMLHDQRLETWVDAVRPVERSEQLVQAIWKIRKRVCRDACRQGLFALLYTIDPKRSLSLSPAVALETPSDLEAGLSRAPEAAAKLREMIVDGCIDEWLRGAKFPGREDDGDFIGDCRSRFASDPDLVCWAVRWRFDPKLPFPFGRERVNDPKALSALIDRDAASTRLGRELLDRGWVRTWLVATGRLANQVSFDRALADPSASTAAKLEAVLHLLDRDLAKPRAVVSRSFLDLGKITLGGEQRVVLSIRNGERGYLAGTIVVADPPAGVTVDTAVIEGEPASIAVTAVARGLPVGSAQQTRLVIATNGNTIDVPVRFRVAAPLAEMLLRSLASGVLVGMWLAFLRLLMDGAVGLLGRPLHIPSFGDTLDRIMAQGPTGADFGVVGLGLLLGATTAGGIYYLTRRGANLG